MKFRLTHSKDKDPIAKFYGRFNLYTEEPNYRHLCKLEYSIPSKFYHIYLKQDGDMTFSLGAGLLTFWLSIPPLIKNYYNDIFHFSFHDNTLFWRFNRPTHYYSSETPKCLDGSFHFDDFFLGKSTYTEKFIAQKLVPIPMPEERSYKANVTLYEAIWKRPRWFAKKVKCANIEMLDNEQIPIPGKGENSYDCDDDTIFSMSVPAESIEEGVGKLVADVLRIRMKRMGKYVWDKVSK